MPLPLPWLVPPLLGWYWFSFLVCIFSFVMLSSDAMLRCSVALMPGSDASSFDAFLNALSLSVSISVYNRLFGSGLHSKPFPIPLIVVRLRPRALRPYASLPLVIIKNIIPPNPLWLNFSSNTISSLCLLFFSVFTAFAFIHYKFEDLITESEESEQHCRRVESTLSIALLFSLSATLLRSDCAQHCLSTATDHQSEH